MLPIKNKTYLITGADGFIGQAVTNLLLKLNKLQVNCEIRRVVRQEGCFLEGTSTFFVGDINSQTYWGEALEGVDTLIHLAGIKHHGKIKDLHLLRRMWDVNVDGVINLAKQALKYKLKDSFFFQVLVSMVHLSLAI